VIEQLAAIAGERFVERADDVIARITPITAITAITLITVIAPITVITLVTVVALTEPFVIGRRLRR